MSHFAQALVESKHAVFSNSSPDDFANGVEISKEGHVARIWVDDSDADVSTTAVIDGNKLNIAINTNPQAADSATLLIVNGALSHETKISLLSGIDALIIDGPIPWLEE